MNSGWMRLKILVVIIPAALMSSGCFGPLHVVMGDSYTAKSSRIKCRYFAATRMDTHGIKSVWYHEDTLLPGKVLGTAFLVADIPLSVTFDVLIDGPLKLVRGRCESPWKKVRSVNLDGVRICQGMSRQKVIDAVESLESYKIALARARQCQVLRPDEDFRWVDIYFQRGEVAELYVYREGDNNRARFR